MTKNLSQNVVHSDSDLILHNSSVLIDKEPKNWYITIDNCIITVNAYSYTVITAHKVK
ncbi:DUF3781 domain-containing protein [Enterococcus faecium]|uniref:DUF3781 domain-containing protein n=1 Tax=Enterococcus faecium TaxID=1352 RepID=UPI003F75FAE3